jgi:putative tryptophan/tyrosine transport system substrate-binding protein
MRRREFITIVAGATITRPFAAMGQEAGRTYRLGMLLPFPREAPPALAILDELRRRGFIEGQNLTVDYRDFGQQVDLLPEYTEQLVKAQPDVLYVGGGGAIRTTQQTTKTIPILGVTDDMVGEGLVGSLARPNGNTTGISILATELDGKRQDVLIEAVPGIRRMAALADSNTTTAIKIHTLQEAAGAHDVALLVYRIAKGEMIPSVIDEAKASGATALNVLASPMFYVNRRPIMERVAALGLPTMYQWPEMAEEGGFAAYGPRLNKLPELGARMIAKLLQGIKPADIPVEQPTTFELVINLKTANALGVTVPPKLLGRADNVIE